MDTDFQRTSSHPIQLSIVLPMKDEELVIPELHERLSRVLSARTDSYELVFVDDGSIDRSFEVLTSLAAKDHHVSVIQLSANFGQTAALAAGIDHARGKVIVTMDSDLQHSPEDIPRFLDKLAEGYDIVSGWRQVRTDSFLWRRFPSRCANTLVRKLTQSQVRDVGSTFKACRAEVLKSIELFGDLHRFVPILAQRLGARLTEIPIEVHPRVKGSSKYGIGRTPGVLEDILFLVFYCRYLTRPLRAFGVLFFVFFGLGFGIASWMMFLWTIGWIPTVNGHSGMLLFAALLMLMGIQFLMTGIVTEILSRIYINTGKQKLYFVRSYHPATTAAGN